MILKMVPSQGVKFHETTYQVHYIPHQLLEKDSLSTPIRIAYDCSCQDSEFLNLNGCLSSTPPQLYNLNDILKRYISIHMSMVCKPKVLQISPQITPHLITLITNQSTS